MPRGSLGSPNLCHKKTLEADSIGIPNDVHG